MLDCRVSNYARRIIPISSLAWGPVYMLPLEHVITTLLGYFELNLT